VHTALVLPPLCQLNTPYPSIAYLARALRDAGQPHSLHDLGIELVHRVFSREGLTKVFADLQGTEALPEPAWRAMAMRDQHIRVVESVVRFLTGRDRTLASRILDTPFLPGGPRLDAADLDRFGPMGTDDAARYLATLYLEDLADLIQAGIDPGFGLAQYQHHLATGPVRFDPIADRLGQTTVIDAMLDALTDQMLARSPDLVAISVPFPGMLVAGLRIGRRAKAAGARVVMGGGYINTELRDVDEPRLWESVDALTYDDGEGPLLALLEHLSGGEDRRHRTRTAEGLHEAEVSGQTSVPAAWYGDLRLDDYLQVLDTLNPAHRLWSDGRWNKLTLAHGCYWKKCAFCDVSLDYISRFEPARIDTLLDAMGELIDETGQSGFHLVDEAAPPKLMRDLALGILSRELAVTWWGNIRFEPTFTPDLCRLLAASGCVAVTGGLEVASDRLLKLMDKGITVEQAARSAQAFTDAGIMVHAYLMYGFPSQTTQETVDAMEVVRQMFAAGLLTSAFWHRFVLTRHAPIYQDPARFGIEIPPLPEGPIFATNDIPHTDSVGADPVRFDRDLVHALHAWMEGEHLERPAHIWFDPPLVPTTEPPRRIDKALKHTPEIGERLVWLGGEVLDAPDGLVLHHADGTVQIGGRSDERDWLCEVIEAARPGEDPLTLSEVQEAFPGEWRRFQKRWEKVREAGMVCI
jgi:hypothetical protein